MSEPGHTKRSVFRTESGVIRTASALSRGSRKAAMDAVRMRRERRKKIRKAYKYMLAAIGVIFVILLIVLAVRRITGGFGTTSAERVSYQGMTESRAEETDAAEDLAGGAEEAGAVSSAGESQDGNSTQSRNRMEGWDETDGAVSKITFTAVGDNLIHGSIFKQAAARADGDGYDFSYSYAPVKDYFEAHDLNWINMETLVNNEFPASNYPKFSTPGQDALDLYDAGFRIFSIASNHTYDLGNKGVRAMKYFYRDEMPSDILTTGIWEDTDDIPVYEYRGRKIAFLTYTYGMNEDSNEESGRVIYLTEKSLIKYQIGKAKEQADCVIVSCHWGDEDKHAINDEQRQTAREIAEWGADLIIGTHPHVVQDYTRIETSDGREVFCAYSIGNFISGQKDIDHLVGLVLECTLAFESGADGKVSVSVEDPKLVPIITHYDSAFTNLRVMFLEDYTPEMADRHGVQEYSGFSYDEIFHILETYVVGDVLVLPEKKSRIS